MCLQYDYNETKVMFGSATSWRLTEKNNKKILLKVIISLYMNYQYLNTYMREFVIR